MTFTQATLFYFDKFFSGLTKGKLWILKSVFVITLISWLCSFPNYHYFLENNKIERIELIEKQINHPLDKNNYSNLHPGSHESKRVFRIFIPAIAHFFSLNFFQILIIQNITGIIFLCLLLLHFFKSTKDKILSCYLILGITSIYIGKSFYYDILGFYDFFSFLFLFFIYKTNNKFLQVILIICGGFIDERFIIALPIIAISKYYLSDKSGLISSFSPFVMGVCSILLIRFYLRNAYHLEIPTSSNSNLGLNVLVQNFHFIPIGIFSGLEFLWMIVIFSLYTLFKAKKILISLALLSCIILIISVSLIVFDITRSMSYLFPILLFSLVSFRKRE